MNRNSKTTEARIDADVWVDLLSCPDVLLFRGLLNGVDPESIQTTVRQKGRTVDLADLMGFDHTVVGRDFDHAFLRKLGIPMRTLQLMRVPPCDVSVSLCNAMCILASKVHNVPSIHFKDNDIYANAHDASLPFTRFYNRLEAMATYNVVPAAFKTEVLTDVGADPNSIYTYDGYKEDIYVGDFVPNPAFPDQLPFDRYVVVRPEALSADYVHATRSIVPELLAGLIDNGFNIVYLPRYRGDESYADPYPADRVFVPDEPLPGLQLAWHAECVLTGSGTMAREAASMDKPAVSFFPSTLLSVDRELVDDGRIFHSRDPEAIVEYIELLSTQKIRPDLTRAKETRTQVITLVTELAMGARHRSATSPIRSKSIRGTQ